MTSNRRQHIKPSSTVPTGSDTRKARALRNLSEDESDSAAMKKSALSEPSAFLMDQIVDEQNVEQAWRKVKANKGAPGPDGITLDEFPARFRTQWPTIRQQLLDGTYAPLTFLVRRTLAFGREVKALMVMRRSLSAFDFGLGQ